MLLKEPLRLGRLTVSNRLVMPPMATRKSHEGAVSEDICRYYEARARGGYIGLIITEHCYIERRGRANDRQISLADDADRDGLKALTAAIHIVGATKVFAQINHAGIVSDTDEPVGPSSDPVYHPSFTRTKPVHELTAAEIGQLTASFAAAALRAKEAGYDGVEIHSAHGYLLNQFYSPLTNRRHDAYGCDSIANRTRFHVEVIQAVRAAVGDDFPIALRLGGCDYREGGSTIADSAAAARIFADAGINMLDVSGGMCGYTRNDTTAAGYFGDMTEAIKRAVSLPVLLTGGITMAADAERLLQQGKADLIGVGRAVMKDPLWAQKAMQ